MEKTLTRMKQAGWVLGAAALAFGSGIWIVFGKQLPPQVPLFYSRPWGEEQLAAPIWLFLPLALAVIAAAGGGIAVRALKNEKVLGILVLVALIVSQIMLTLGLLRIVLLVI